MKLCVVPLTQFHVRDDYPSILLKQLSRERRCSFPSVHRSFYRVHFLRCVWMVGYPTKKL